MSDAKATTSASEEGRTEPPGDDQQSREHELRHVRDALRGLKFGTVTLIVQDGVVVQIDRTEKRRLRSGKSQPERDK